MTVPSVAAILPLYAIALLLGTPATADEPASPVTPSQVATLAKAGSTDEELQTIMVQATAIPGNAIDVDKIPGNVQTLYSSDLSRDGTASLTRAMDAQLGSVNINDNLDDPFQPDILYRGFEASPVLGTPQGLAVYQNGVRINEAFGNTVNWDLFPDIAITRVDIVSSNPVYGLNALGGGISVSMKSGFNYKGADLELSGGSFEQRAATVQFGASSEQFGVYVGGKALNESGWRSFAGDSLRQLYAVVSARSDRASIDLSYTTADNHLDGQGSAPVQELAISRGLAFTGPQADLDRLEFLTLNGAFKMSNTWSLQSVLYYRQYEQSVANGNTTGYTSCAGAANPGLLCQPDGISPVTNSAGAVMPDISAGGAIPIGEIDYESTHTFGRGAALQITATQSIAGHENHFTAGATLDHARVNFHSDAQIGVINSNLVVLPSNLVIDTPESPQAGASFRATPVSLHAANHDYGIYATDTVDVTPKSSLTASGRYNIADIELRDRLGTNLSGNNRYAHFNPAIGGTYKVLPTLTLYAGISENTRAPTAGEIECSDPLRPCLLPSNLAGDPPTLRQVVAHTTELGVRSNRPDKPGPKGDLQWNLSVFRTQLHDDIYGIATSVSSGFFQNIGATRRRGIEAGSNYRTANWSAYVNYSYVDATFQSALTLPSPLNPFQDASGNIGVEPGDRLPGIPRHRLKAGADYRINSYWTVGATVNIVSDQYYFGDESNRNPRIPGHHVVGLHSSYQLARKIQVFATIDNALNSQYSTYGVLGDPAGIGAPGIPAGSVTNGPGVDNRFQSPAPPFAVYCGVRVTP